MLMTFVWRRHELFALCFLFFVGYHGAQCTLKDCTDDAHSEALCQSINVDYKCVTNIHNPDTTACACKWDECDCQPSMCSNGGKEGFKDHNTRTMMVSDRPWASRTLLSKTLKPMQSALRKALSIENRYLSVNVYRGFMVKSAKILVMKTVVSTMADVKSTQVKLKLLSLWVNRHFS